MNLTSLYKNRRDQFAIIRPFKVNTEQLELLEPAERIEIETINADNGVRSKKRDNRSDNFSKFALLTDITNRLSNNAKLFSDEDYLTDVVQPWMEIFLWYFEVGYYEDSDTLDIIRNVKENFKLFNEINITKFVQWYSMFAITFIKAALFKIQGKIIKECTKQKRRFESKLKNYIGSDSKVFSLTFGRYILIKAKL